MFLKIQTWFPYNVQIYLNGREYLSRRLKAEDISYSMYNNSFSYIEDFERAQELADRILSKKLSDSFDGMVKKINCLLPDIMEVLSYSYYWCTDQCEFATDIKFKIRKAKEKVQDGKIIQTMEWVPMGKSITNLYRYVEISKAIIKRYLDAIPDISLDKVSDRELMSISGPKEVKGRRYSGFHLLSRETATVLSVIACGDFILTGFDNKSVRQRLYQDSNSHKAINITTRLFSKLRAHGLIKKVPRKNRYYLTSRGRDITNTLLLFLNKELLNSA